jgi:hypothetical protein
MYIVHRGAGSQVQAELGNYGQRQHKEWFECVERPGGDRLIRATRRTWCSNTGDTQPSGLRERIQNKPCTAVERNIIQRYNSALPFRGAI